MDYLIFSGGCDEDVVEEIMDESVSNGNLWPCQWHLHDIPALHYRCNVALRMQAHTVFRFRLVKGGHFPHTLF